DDVDEFAVILSKRRPNGIQGGNAISTFDSALLLHHFARNHLPRLGLGQRARSFVSFDRGSGVFVSFFGVVRRFRNRLGHGQITDLLATLRLGFSLFLFRRGLQRHRFGTRRAFSFLNVGLRTRDFWNIHVQARVRVRRFSVLGGVMRRVRWRIGGHR